MPHWKPTLTAAEFEALVDGFTKRSNTVPFTVLLQSDGTVAGSSSYLDLRLEHRGLEVGFTWIAEDYRGTFVNPEMKLLMLGYAFEQLGCMRVQLKTDLRNIRSQRAMEKLGCVKEGVWRQHMIMPDGYIRDTVMYSILDSEWPGVRERLEERLRR